MITRPEISIIIPIYNADKYLANCLESIRKQSFTNFEVWLINDGSKDNSEQICIQYVEKDNRFNLLNKENGGVSSARNLGLDNAIGSWICFVDADDSIENSYLEDLFTASPTLSPKTFIMQGFTQIEENKKIERRVFPSITIPSENYNQLFNLYNFHRCGFPFGKLYNKDIIRNHQLYFDTNIHYAEDVLFMLSYLLHTKEVIFTPHTNYNYMIRGKNSLSQKISSFESEHLCYQSYLKKIEQIASSFNIIPQDLKKPYHVISEYLIRRSIGSLYRKDTMKSYHQRIKILKGITTKELLFLQSYYQPTTPVHRITVALIKQKRYLLCDIYLRLVGWVRSYF